MDIIKFTGWVEAIYEPTQYSKDIVVANYSDDNHKETLKKEFSEKKSQVYPVALRLSASVKSGAASQLDLIGKGDKVEVQFMVSGKSGISSKTGSYYCINSLNIIKKDGIRVIQKGADAQMVNASSDDADIPF